MLKLLRELDYLRLESIANGSFGHYVNNECFDVSRLAMSVHNNVRMEGNTISYNDTIKLMVGALTPHEALNKYKTNEVFEVDGSKNAVLYAYDNIGTELTEGFILNLHKFVYDGVEERHRGIYAGQYRTSTCFTVKTDGGK